MNRPLRGRFTLQEMSDGRWVASVYASENGVEYGLQHPAKDKAAAIVWLLTAVRDECTGTRHTDSDEAA